MSFSFFKVKICERKSNSIEQNSFYPIRIQRNSIIFNLLELIVLYPHLSSINTNLFLQKNILELEFFNEGFAIFLKKIHPPPFSTDVKIWELTALVANT